MYVHGYPMAMQAHKHTYAFFFLLLLNISVSNKAQVLINEILVCNNSVTYDPHFYNFSDWIEIYNGGSTEVDLMGYTLTDDMQIPDKYRIGYHLNIGSHGRTVIWADGESWYPHTNFSLDCDGELVALFDPNGVLVDSLRYGVQHPDISYGRYPDGSNEWYYIGEPTYSKSNLPGVKDGERVSDYVVFSQEGGFYPGPVLVTLMTSSPTATIRYTTNGTWPDKGSEVYDAPITISENTVLRARAFEDGFLPGLVSTVTYFVDEKPTLPVISLSTDPSYFFNSRYGIYVVGTNGVAGNCVDSAVNFNQPWERAVNMEYFLPEGQCKVNQVVGVKIAGRCSRTRTIKSLGIYSREKYGKVGIEGVQFFNSKTLDSPKDLLLRNSGTECYSTYLRDGFMQTLVMDRMDLDFQAYQPVTVYINGRYWGIHNLREKMNEHYVESNYGIDPQSIDLLEYNTISDYDMIIQGDSSLYNQFLLYIKHHDLRIPENYEYVKSQMDVNEFMNILIANIYFENEDWPNNNNKFWRQRIPEGKWRWYMFDLDFGFGYWPRSGNTVEWVFGRAPDSEIAFNLKSNAEFRNEFIQRMASHLNTTFLTERVLNVLDSLKSNIDQEMYHHIERWGSPWSHEKWESNIKEMADFAMGRTPVVISQMMQEFGLSGTYQLDIKNMQPEFGGFEIAGVNMSGDVSGIYFDDIPMQIRAVPENGYQFAGWTGGISTEEPVITVQSSENISLVAKFRRADPLENLRINEIQASNKSVIQDECSEYEDWLEIYNGNDYPVDLAGCYLSDSAGFLTQFQIQLNAPQQTTIPAKGYKLFWADDEPDEGSLHLSFKLKKDGEHIFLSQNIGTDIQIIDSISYSRQYDDISYGRDIRVPEVLKFLEPTPEAENKERNIENIYINEFMASNRSVLQDKDGLFDDWIELFNSNDYPVNVAGMFISDDIENPAKFRIPDTCADSTTIPAGGYLVLWADDSTEQGILHLSFKLSNNGEKIILTGPNGIDHLDSVSYPGLIPDTPYGRSVDGSGVFCVLPATPGASNKMYRYDGIMLSELMAADHQILEDELGEFNDWIELYNSTSHEINVAGMLIGDTMEPSESYMIPFGYPENSTVPPDGYLLLWADNSPEKGVLHLNFGLKEKGEQLGIFTPEGSILDTISFPHQYDNFSYSRFEHDLWMSVPPTPGASNKTLDLSRIFINEIMTSNVDNHCDNYGEYDDWIEIYNGGLEAIDMGGLFITDSVGDPDPFRISSDYPDSTTIPSGGYIVLWADDSTEQGVMHTNFKLSRSGEQVAILGYDGQTIIDSVSYGLTARNISFGRINDGGMPWQVLSKPTPLSSNELIFTKDLNSIQNEFHCELFPNPVSSRVTLSFEVDVPSDVMMKVFDQAGRLVDLPVEGYFTSGHHNISWEWNHQQSALLGPGIYFYIVYANGVSVRGKIIVTRPH